MAAQWKKLRWGKSWSAVEKVEMGKKLGRSGKSRGGGSDFKRGVSRFLSWFDFSTIFVHRLNGWRDAPMRKSNQARVGENR